MYPRRPFIVANWKMNKTLAEVSSFQEGLSKTKTPSLTSQVDIGIAPQSIHLGTLKTKLQGSGLLLVSQNCGPERFGAHTGEISPESLLEMGVTTVILGHSERRHIYKEDNQQIFSRLKAAAGEGLAVILCIGEGLLDRQKGNTFKVIEDQLSILKQPLAPEFYGKLSLAYEPVWAIGTGETATPAQAQEVHLFIRGWIKEHLTSQISKETRILYGGSVKPENAAAIMLQPDVDGLLVGGASLNHSGFAEIVKNGLDSWAIKKVGD